MEDGTRSSRAPSKTSNVLTIQTVSVRSAASPTTAKTKGKQLASASTKPKQSKSRNGCLTCKKKRLKCDEAKPTCAQCEKRNVTCDGYKKDFKWRTFEETTEKSRATSKKKTIPRLPKPPSPGHHWTPHLQYAFASASHAIQQEVEPAIVPCSSFEADSGVYDLPELEKSLDASKFDFPSPLQVVDLEATPVPHEKHHRRLSVASGSPGSPLPFDLEVPDQDADAQSADEEDDAQSAEKPHGALDEKCEGGDSGVDMVAGVDGMVPPDSPQSINPTGNNLFFPSISSPVSPGAAVLDEASIDLASPEMLLLRFDSDTCGILSVKDGPTENPWRTLIWPLARDCEALYHALFSMTAFHGAYQVPELRVAGVAHMTTSIRKLADDIEGMRLDAALATSLVLAIGEGWDQKTHTGIHHLRGAQFMVNYAVSKYQQDSSAGNLTIEDALRLKFLCNTFVYLDVIARLSSNTEAHDLDLNKIMTIVGSLDGDLLEVDPLMGCATTLFPLIGQVANLVQRARQLPSSSLAIVSQAMALREQLLHWRPPSTFKVERPEDSESEVQHSIQTAEAYRFAILLYLQQAVPEIPADPSQELAKRVLMLLASVPLSSRTTVVQRFPLFVASCEMTTEEDRHWVVDRWVAMITRLQVGSVDSCWQVVQEVWLRRDAHEDAKAQRLARRLNSSARGCHSLDGLPGSNRRAKASDISLDHIEPEYTVRGHLHWLGVMSEWEWEVFLG